MSKELIDFGNWLINEGYCLENPMIDLVEDYLKSINSAQRETPSVGEKEQSEEICPSCESGDCTIIRIPMNRCNECGVEWQIG